MRTDYFFSRWAETQNYILTVIGLLVEVPESQWLFFGPCSVCHLPPWSKVIMVSIVPSVKKKQCDVSVSSILKFDSVWLKQLEIDN